MPLFSRLGERESSAADAAEESSARPTHTHLHLYLGRMAYLRYEINSKTKYWVQRKMKKNKNK